LSEIVITSACASGSCSTTSTDAGSCTAVSASSFSYGGIVGWHSTPQLSTANTYGALSASSSDRGDDIFDGSISTWGAAGSTYRSANSQAGGMEIYFAAPLAVKAYTAYCIFQNAHDINTTCYSSGSYDLAEFNAQYYDGSAWQNASTWTGDSNGPLQVSIAGTHYSQHWRFYQSASITAHVGGDAALHLSEIVITSACTAGASLAVTQPAHAFDFRGCTAGSTINDQIGSLTATPQNSPACSSAGATFVYTSSQYFDITDFSWGGPISVEVYASFTATAGGHPRAFYSGSDTETDAIMYYMTGSSGTGLFRFNEHGNVEAAGGSLGDNGWHHAVMVLSGSSMTGYIDGVQAATATITAPTSKTRTSNLVGCGRYGSSINGCMSGSVAYVRVWNAGLAASDVTALYGARNSSISSWAR